MTNNVTGSCLKEGKTAFNIKRCTERSTENKYGREKLTMIAVRCSVGVFGCDTILVSMLENGGSVDLSATWANDSVPGTTHGLQAFGE